MNHRKLRIEKVLTEHLHPESLQVECSMEGTPGGSIHVLVKGDVFKGLSKLQQQRKVIDLIEEEIKQVHSVSIRTISE